MKAFRFRLDAPLRLAQIEVGRLRRDLASALREMIEIESAIDATVEEQCSVDGELLSRVQIGIAGEELHALSLARERVRSRIPGLEARQAQIRESELEIKRDLAAISRQVNVLERLRADARAAHVKDLLDREQAESDDLTLQRRARGSHSAPSRRKPS